LSAGASASPAGLTVRARPEARPDRRAANLRVCGKDVKKESSTARRETKGERRERPERGNENPLLNNLPLGEEGETTAMAEAFRAAARQRTKEEPEGSQE